MPETALVRGRNWCLVAVFLLAWNGFAAWHASPKTLIQSYDGAQYHLLARNRLRGHTEMADTAHTVRSEGAHPMWRPGLVWLIEGLAGLAGSVRLAAALASALGTSLMELALLWLARHCFGPATAGATFLCMVTPLTISSHFLRLAVGQGPEPWATACVLAGLAALVEARRRRSWSWAALAGSVAGLSEWFRTGNLVLFAVPCLIYMLASLRQRPRWVCALPALAVASFVAASAAGSQLVPSAVDKATANLWGNLVETEGPQLKKRVPVFGVVSFSMGGLELAPGTHEVYYDYLVRRSRDIPARQFLSDKLDDFVLIYGQRLGEVVKGVSSGLRYHTGELLFALFLGQVVLSLVRRPKKGLWNPSSQNVNQDLLEGSRPLFWARRLEDIHVLAFAGGAMAFYLGPVVFLQGDQPTQYLLVMVPLFAAVGAHGIVNLGRTIAGYAARRWPDLVEPSSRVGGLLRVPLAAGAGCLCLLFYHGAITTLQVYQQESAAEQADLDALHLEGKTVACRNMTWFVDRNVQTVLFPFAKVPALERYVRAHQVDGILIWDKEKSLFFLRTPYGPREKFEEALRESPWFGSPQVSGAWHWYPVRRLPSAWSER
jgi:hypothetical protein